MINDAGGHFPCGDDQRNVSLHRNQRDERVLQMQDVNVRFVLPGGNVDVQP